MKFLFLLPAILAGSLSFASSVPPVDCFKAAMANPAVLAADKAFDATNPNKRAESSANRLCRNAATADGPISCDLAALSDSAVFVADKAFDAAHSTNRAQGDAIELCGGGQ